MNVQIVKALRGNYFRHYRAAGRKQAGQVMPVALMGVMVTAAMLIAMYNAGQKLTEKSLATNAADAAAYSGAVWTARHLNFMAYTNRAMVANHVAVGHYISYTAWLRYVKKNAKNVNKVGKFIPFVGTYTQAAEKITAAVDKFNDKAAPILVGVTDTLNATYRVAQVEIQASLALGGVDNLMTQTARSYNPNFVVNDNDMLQSLPAEFGLPLLAKVNLQKLNIPTFVKQYTASNDKGRINDLIGKTINSDGDNTRWIAGQRGWQVGNKCAGFRKRGSTAHSQTSKGANWDGRDRLQGPSIDLSGCDWKNIGSEGKATATEFVKNYQGVPSYYGTKVDSKGNPTDSLLEIRAVTGIEQGKVVTRNVLGVESGPAPMLASAMAKVEFKRPVGFGFAALPGNQKEYSNLFNPFWEAHLAPDTLFKL
jgi:hypothetical protein